MTWPVIYSGWHVKKRELQINTFSDYITTHLLKLVDLSDEEVSIATSHFGICDVDHVLCEMQTNWVYLWV